MDSKNEAFIDGWIYIDKIDKIPETSETIYCDTRDFHIICQDEPYYNIDCVKHVCKGSKESYLYDLDEILPYLKSLENGSGGKGGWRYLVFNINQKGVFKDWVKYIRFIKDDVSGKYICYTGGPMSDYHPLDKNLFTAKNINKKSLCFDAEDD